MAATRVTTGPQVYDIDRQEEVTSKPLLSLETSFSLFDRKTKLDYTIFVGYFN